LQALGRDPFLEAVTGNPPSARAADAIVGARLAIPAPSVAEDGPVDPRIQAYARVLVDCIEPQPGWQVSVRSQPPARPLIEDICRELGRRAARALGRLNSAPHRGRA